MHINLLAVDGNKGCKNHALKRVSLYPVFHLRNEFKVGYSVYRGNNGNFHSTSLPKLFLVLALTLKQLQEGKVSVVVEHSPKSTSRFSVITDHSFGPSI